MFVKSLRARQLRVSARSHRSSSVRLTLRRIPVPGSDPPAPHRVGTASKLVQARHPLVSHAKLAVNLPSVAAPKALRERQARRCGIFAAAFAATFAAVVSIIVANSLMASIFQPFHVSSSHDLVDAQGQSLQCANPDLFVGFTSYDLDISEANHSSNVSASGSKTSPVLRDRGTGLPVEVASVDSKVIAGRLVDRTTNDTLQTSAVDSAVFAGLLVERSTGKVVQTQPATSRFVLGDGIITMCA